MTHMRHYFFISSPVCRPIMLKYSHQRSSIIYSIVYQTPYYEKKKPK